MLPLLVMPLPKQWSFADVDWYPPAQSLLLQQIAHRLVIFIEAEDGFTVAT